MNSEGKIIIASTSDSIIDYVCNRLDEIGAKNEIYRASDGSILCDCLINNSPRILLIENSFWHSATPLELMLLTSRFNTLRIYVFEVADYANSYVKRTMRVGVDGYLTVRKGRTRFRNELKEVLRGNMVVPPEIAYDCFDYFSGIDDHFTKRDFALISLICQELDNKEIGKILKLKVQSVKNRRSKMYAKVNAKNSVGLLKYLFRNRLLDINEFLSF